MPVWNVDTGRCGRGWYSVYEDLESAVSFLSSRDLTSRRGISGLRVSQAEEKNTA